MKYVQVTCLLTLLSIMACHSDPAKDSLIYQLLDEQPGKFRKIIEHPDQYGLQIIYTQIDRDSLQNPHFSSHYYHVDNNRYFYPASTVKFPIALMAMEKLRELDIDGLDLHSTMLTDSSRSSQLAVHTDSTAANLLPSAGHYIKKIFLVSDNEASNRLYEFVGQKRINERLAEAGYAQSKITHRLSSFLSKEEDRYTNPIRFVDDSGKVIYAQAEAYSDYSFPKGTDRHLKGKGYLEQGQLVEQAKDFGESNEMPLADLHRMLQRVIFPESVPAQQRFNLSDADYQFLYKAMGQLPGESRHPDYPLPEYYDSYCKFLLFGDSHQPIPEYIRIYNKVGMAYGYLIDNAYIIDEQSGVEFMLSAVIYVNENGIFNDDQYEYESLGFPFLAHLGKIIYAHELKRKKDYPPDLSRFTSIDYKDKD